jgi:osmotically-inducible protein OsmY
VAKFKQISVLTLTLMLAAAMGGCESFGRCTSDYCVADAKITADVSALLAQHAALGAPGSVQVQTIKGVVYLNGVVDTDLDRSDAEAIAYQAANVKDVVNSISVRGNGR